MLAYPQLWEKPHKIRVLSYAIRESFSVARHWQCRVEWAVADAKRNNRSWTHWPILPSSQSDICRD